MHGGCFYLYVRMVNNNYIHKHTNMYLNNSHGKGYLSLICSNILKNASLLDFPCRSRHMNSSKYDGNDSLRTPFIFLKLLLTL